MARIIAKQRKGMMRMTNVLIAYASKYGSTKEIAEHIALILRREGLTVDVKDAETVSSLRLYHAVIVGSALYFDNWIASAREFLESFQDELKGKRVWLFSSGITGDGDFREMIDWYYPEALKELVEVIEPKDVALFGGKVDSEMLQLEDWLVNPGVRAKTNDYRDWIQIEAWAMEIAKTLVVSTTQGVTMVHHTYFTKEDAKRVGDVLKINWTKIDLEQFRRGMDVELEHGRENPLTDVTHDDAILTGKIALAHLNEVPDYYTRLEKMEEEARHFWQTAERK
jgi:menaquinone-dependent protoporphyrinogen oxidase